MASAAPAPDPSASQADLPTRWNPKDVHKRLELSADGLEFVLTGPENIPDGSIEAASVRADRPFLAPQGIGYFEVTILRGRKKADSVVRCAVGVGTSSINKTTLERYPGCDHHTFGYHGDDGMAYSGSMVGRAYGLKWVFGDVVGCGINFSKGTIFWTLNGVRKDDIAYTDKDLVLYPMVGIKDRGLRVRANFGASPFVYDIGDLYNQEKARIWSQIKATSLPSPGPGELSEMQQLVLQFLQHEGYADTARALADDINQQRRALDRDGSQNLAPIDLGDETDVNARRDIRRAIIQGNIDRAIELTSNVYPAVLPNNSMVHIRLRCRKFIELVIQAIALRKSIAALSAAASSHNMDIDSNNSTEFERMDTDKDGESGGQRQDKASALVALEVETIKYGRVLNAEFGSDPRPEVQNLLTDVFAMMAYEHPENEDDVAPLLDLADRTRVAEELNAAILAEQGKPTRSDLEVTWVETAERLEHLKTHKPSTGAPFVSMEDIFDGRG
jgi:hypothetical protein